MKRIGFSKEANLDIEEISTYIFDLNPVAAYRFLDALDKTCELLVEHPLLGRMRSELGEGIRTFAVGNYLIFYVPAKDGIDIIRLIYGGRDLPGVFHSSGND
jgi:toxin ParE1/3/4